MELSTGARGDYEACFGRAPFDLVRCDPEFSALFSRFAFEEAAEESKLDPKTRYLAILAALMGCQGIETFRAMAPAALRAGVTAVELKELVYQGAAYLGLGRTLPFLQQANQLLEEHGVPLPLPPRTPELPALAVACGEGVVLEMRTPARAPTPGQLAVLYLGDVVAASGWIAGAERLPGPPSPEEGV